jgi:hypothetical protein
MMDPKTRQSICEEWIDRVFGPELKKKALFAPAEDPFRETVRSDFTTLVELLFSDAPVDATTSIPEGVVRLRAVQEISAAEAVSHLFVLKDLVRERLGGSPGYEALSRRLDFLALHTFNAYAKCRDDLYRLRIREMTEYGPEETFGCRSSASSRPAAPAQVVSRDEMMTGGAP